MELNIILCFVLGRLDSILSIADNSHFFLGLWYAQRSKDRQEKDVNLLPTLSMDASQVRNVGRMLDSLDERDYASKGTKRPEHRAGASYQPEPDDDLSDEWDKRISSIVKKEFEDGKLRNNFFMHYSAGYSKVGRTFLESLRSYELHMYGGHRGFLSSGNSE